MDAIESVLGTVIVVLVLLTVTLGLLGTPRPDDAMALPDVEQGRSAMTSDHCQTLARGPPPTAMSTRPT